MGRFCTINPTFIFGERNKCYVEMVSPRPPPHCPWRGLPLPGFSTPQQEGKNPDAQTPDTQQFPAASSNTTTTKTASTISTGVHRDGVSNSIKRQRLLDATALLRDLSRNKGVLDEELSPEEKKSFLAATGRFFFGHPDHRFQTMATKRKQRAADQQTLKNTGIRRLRDMPVYVTPSPPQPSPPPRLLSSPSPSSQRTRPPSSQKETATSGITTKRGAVKKEDNEAQEREKKESFEIPGQTTTNATKTTEESRHCYVCKARFTSVHHFYDQLCPDNDNCAPLNFRKRGELADLSGKVTKVLSVVQGSTGYCTYEVRGVIFIEQNDQNDFPHTRSL